ncbi:hypothetical protein SUGI_0842650 [Cryptomeria japonica]|nr:hypothetical protein SUGI_0842650 [Cryptomeria japonica]
MYVFFHLFWLCNQIVQRCIVISYENHFNVLYDELKKQNTRKSGYKIGEDELELIQKEVPNNEKSFSG